MEDNNVESTILPLLSICSMTGEYQKKINTKNTQIVYSLLTSTAELPEQKTPQLLKLIDECQECFEKEAEFLVQNDLSLADVEILFSRYKQFLVGTYILKSDFYDPHNEIHFDSSDKAWFFDETLSFDNTSITNSNTSSSCNDIYEYDIEHASMSLTSNVLNGIPPTSLDFEHSQLYNEVESLYPDSAFLLEGRINSPIVLSGDEIFVTSATNNLNGTHKPKTQFVNGKRGRITKEAKSTLEAIFSVKSSPNNAERNLIAKKCNLTPSQVRIWFTNTRARRKVKSPVSNTSP